MINAHRYTRTTTSHAFSDFVQCPKDLNCFLEFSKIPISIPRLSMVHIGHLFFCKTWPKFDHAINLQYSIIGSKRHISHKRNSFWNLIRWGLSRGHLNDILGDIVWQKLYWCKVFRLIKWSKTAISECEDVFLHSWNCGILFWIYRWDLEEIIYKDLTTWWQTLRIIFLEEISFVDVA